MSVFAPETALGQWAIFPLGAKTADDDGTGADALATGEEGALAVGSVLTVALDLVQLSHAESHASDTAKEEERGARWGAFYRPTRTVSRGCYREITAIAPARRWALAPSEPSGKDEQGQTAARPKP